METKYTNGPWAISKIGNDYDQYMVYAETDNRGNNIAHAVEGKANAELIAAAPELLEACNMVLIASEDNGDMEDIDFAQLRGAIAKATGR